MSRAYIWILLRATAFSGMALPVIKLLTYEWYETQHMDTVNIQCFVYRPDYRTDVCLKKFQEN